MSGSELAVRIDDMNKVVELMLKGYKVHEIVKETGIKRASVLDHLDEWKKWAFEQQDVMGRAREMLASVDQHYDLIMKELWEVVEETGAARDQGVKVNALKAIAAVEKDRAALFQTAGMNDQSMLANEIRETERKQELLVKILKEVSLQCPRCKIEVAERLSKITGKSVVMDVTPPDAE